MDFKNLELHILAFLKENLSKKLLYHNLQHSIDVAYFAEFIGKKENCNPLEITLLKTAALLHDSGFIKQYFHNEKFAIELARQLLPDFGYNVKQIEIISSIIASTEVKITPTTHLQKILKDADYYNFGLQQYTNSAMALREEMELYGTSYSDVEWKNVQIKFLEKHRYYTQAAISEWLGTKKANLNKLKGRL